MGFDPVTMTVLAVAGGAMSAAGGMAKADANAAAMDYKAQVAHNNKLIAEQNAEWTEKQGLAEESAQAMKTRAGVGRLKANLGASGVDINVGSPVKVLESAAKLGELDALTIRSNTARRVYGYKVAGDSADAEAQLAKMSAESIRTAAPFEALGSLLSSASSVGGRFAKWQNVSGTPAGEASSIEFTG